MSAAGALWAGLRRGKFGAGMRLARQKLPGDLVNYQTGAWATQTATSILPPMPHAENAAGVTPYLGQTAGAMSTAGGLGGAAIGGLLGGPLGAGVGQELGKALTGLPEKLHKFAEGVNEGNKGLAKYNGQLALAFAKQEYGDLRRTFSRATATSGSASSLAGSIDSFRDAVEPGVTAMLNTMNGLAKTVVEGASSLAGVFNWLTTTGKQVLETLHVIDKNTSPSKPKKPPFLDSMQQWADRANQPKLK